MDYHQEMTYRALCWALGKTVIPIVGLACKPENWEYEGDTFLLETEERLYQFWCYPDGHSILSLTVEDYILYWESTAPEEVFND